MQQNSVILSILVSIVNDLNHFCVFFSPEDDDDDDGAGNFEMELANMDMEMDDLLGEGPENQQTNVKWVSGTHRPLPLL